MLAGGDPEFLDEMSLEPMGDGRFRGALTSRFCAPVLPQGGITTGLALAAASRTLDRPDLEVRSLHTTFAGMVPAGPVDVDVEVLRQGRAASQVLVRIRPGDTTEAGHLVTATFAATRDPEIAFVNTAPPAAPPPEQCRDVWVEDAADHPDFAGPRPTFFEHFEYGHVNQKMPWETDWIPDGEPVIAWNRWKDTPLAADGSSSVLAVVPPLDTLPPSVFQTRGPGRAFDAFLVPSADLYVQVFDHRLTDDGWMLRRNRSRWAGGGMAQAEVEVFSVDGRLLAHANQLMHVRRVERDAVLARVEQTHQDAREG